ncbi:MAG: PEP-CTERM sorting domain-containing protein [Pseudomonadota bacterium]
MNVSRAISLVLAVVLSVGAQAGILTIEMTGHGSYSDYANRQYHRSADIVATYKLDLDANARDIHGHPLVAQYRAPGDWINASVKVRDRLTGQTKHIAENDVMRGTSYDSDYAYLRDVPGNDFYQMSSYSAGSGNYFRLYSYVYDRIDNIINSVALGQSASWIDDNHTDRGYGYGYWRSYDRVNGRYTHHGAMSFNVTSLRASMASTVPEPGVIALFGLAGLMLWGRRRGQKAA